MSSQNPIKVGPQKASDPRETSSRPRAASTENRCGLSQLEQTVPSELILQAATFLSTVSLVNLCKSSRTLRTSCASELHQKKLLHHAFKANPRAFDFLNKANAETKKLILEKTSYEEGYQSKRLGRFVCFRKWKSVSPLQAAALCGDNFLMKKLLSYLEQDNHLRKEARKQLEEVLNRKGNPRLKNAPEVAFAAVATVPTSLSSIASASANLALSSGAATAASSGSGVDRKQSADKKGNIDITKATDIVKVEYADSDEYLAPFKELEKAYSKYLAQYINVYYVNTVELDNLYGRIGECHKRLPYYGLQEFCNPIHFDPTPNFQQEPPREECRHWDFVKKEEVVLDLDEIGLDSKDGLKKGYRPPPPPIHRMSVMAPTVWVTGGGAGERGARCELAAINHLREVRQRELENIIQKLYTFGDSLAANASVGSSVKP